MPVGVIKEPTKNKTIYLQEWRGGASIYDNISEVRIYQKDKNGKYVFITAESWDDIEFDVRAITRKTGNLSAAEAIKHIKEKIEAAPKDLPDFLYLDIDTSGISEGVIFEKTGSDNPIFFIGHGSYVYGSEKDNTIIEDEVRVEEYTIISTGCRIGKESIINQSHVEMYSTIGENVKMDKTFIGHNSTVGRKASIYKKTITPHSSIPAFYNAYVDDINPGDRVISITDNVEGTLIRTGTGEGLYIMKDNGTEVSVNMKYVIKKNENRQKSNVPIFLKRFFEMDFYSGSEFFFAYIDKKAKK